MTWRRCLVRLPTVRVQTKSYLAQLDVALQQQTGEMDSAPGQASLRPVSKLAATLAHAVLDTQGWPVSKLKEAHGWYLGNAIAQPARFQVLAPSSTDAEEIVRSAAEAAFESMLKHCAVWVARCLRMCGQKVPRSIRVGVSCPRHLACQQHRRRA